MQKYFYTFLLLLISLTGVFGQESDSTNFSIYYDSRASYIIADIAVTGIRYYDQQALIQISGLKIGEEIEVPGDAITNAIKKLWSQAIFSDIKITATKIVGNNIWLEIYLQEMPRLTQANFIGVSKSEKDDITEKVLLLPGQQVTENQVNNAKRTIKNIFLAKGFLDTEVNIIQRIDTARTNSIILNIYVDKKEKVKIQDVIFHGNENLKSG
ncbi:MAG: outer membrane protein assembly factor BamA, partial [Prolixibacteraceae bacterium]|nr:outer membrane protein assembly factor BamA [Prolixibacteraceae bacterium]